jgi:tetratricopeptide (TPR) repeat protein
MNYDSDENLNRSLKNLVISRKLILKKYFSDIKKDRETLANHYSGLCISLYENNELEEAKKYSQYLTEIYNYTNKDKKLLSNRLYSIGSNLCLKGNFSEGRKYLLRAVKKYPANIVALLKVFISFFGQEIYRLILKTYNNIITNRKTN